MAERAEQLLRAAAATGLRTRAQCLEHLGRHFRGALDLPGRLTDFQVRHTRSVGRAACACVSMGCMAKAGCSSLPFCDQLSGSMTRLRL